LRGGGPAGGTGKPCRAACTALADPRACLPLPTLITSAPTVTFGANGGGGGGGGIGVIGARDAL